MVPRQVPGVPAALAGDPRSRVLVTLTPRPRCRVVQRVAKPEISSAVWCFFVAEASAMPPNVRAAAAARAFSFVAFVTCLTVVAVKAIMVTHAFVAAPLIVAVVRSIDDEAIFDAFAVVARACAGPPFNKV